MCIRDRAWGSLSHLYYNSPTGTRTDVALAARRAYEEDAYLLSLIHI